MFSLFLVTILNVAAHSHETKSASTLVKEREKELAGSMDVKTALEAIQFRHEIPKAVKEALKPKQHKGAVRAALVQGQKSQQPDADTAAKLDQARVILNKMYIGNQEELDIVIWDCRTYLNTQIALMDENTRLRTMMGAAAARAKAEQLEASAGIKEANGELEQLNGALEEHEAGCAETLGAAREQEAVLANDYTVGMMILNATEETCAKQAAALVSSKSEDKDGKVALLTCKTGAHDDDESYDLGPDYKDLNAHFTTKFAKESMQRMLRMALDRHEAAKEHFGLLQFDRAEMRKRRMQGTLQAPSPAPKTVDAAPAPAPAPISDAHAEAKTLPDRPKCSTDDANCPLLLDQVSSMVGEILDALQTIRKEIADTEFHCKTVTEDYEGQIAEWESILDEDQVKLAKAIEVENTNNEALRQKVIEYEGLNGEYMSKKEECDAKKTEIVNTLCGIKIVRLEVYHNEEVWDILIQDCEVGDWVDQDCDKTCGGGEQSVTREILQEAGPPENPGAECPPVMRKQKCNEQGCPVDCKMTDWSEWTSCSKDCGTGVKQKSRSVDIEAQNGGFACEETDKAQVCNMDACDADCVLAEWAPYEQCTKACNGGIEVRRKPVLEEARGMGKCEDENSKDRFEEKECNMEACPPNLVCNSKADIVLVLDGSGSVRTKGFAATKLFARKLVERMDMNEGATKVGLVRFSKTIDVLEQMTFDQAGLLDKIDSMSFPRRTTSTSKALSMAVDVLKAGGRKDVEKSNTIVFLLTDGKPNNAEATAIAAEAVRAAGRLVVVPVGTGMGSAGLEAMMSWASFPPEENVVQVEKYDQLPSTISGMLADLCKDLMCRETATEADMSDYIGCQTQTVEGLACQAWTDVDEAVNPELLGKSKKGQYSVEAVAGNIVGGHNYCRNPDKKAGGIWCYTTSVETPWDYCEPRASNATGW